MGKSLTAAIAMSTVLILFTSVTEAFSKSHIVSASQVWVCPGTGDSVCGRRNGKARTYSSACAASNDGAVIVGRGACGIHPQAPVPWPWPW
jgi:hypothetical protein